MTAGKCLAFTRGVYGPIGGVLTILPAVGTAVGSEAPQGVQGGAPGRRAAGDWSQQATSWLCGLGPVASTLRASVSSIVKWGQQLPIPRDIGED